MNLSDESQPAPAGGPAKPSRRMPAPAREGGRAQACPQPVVTRRGVLLLPVLVLAGCDQMRAEPVAELPPEVMRGAGDPARFALETAAHHFLDREAALRGYPADAAFAAAMVENASTAFQDGRFADGPWVTRLLREGRTALRQSLGLDVAALPQAVQDALLAAAAAFRRGERDVATAALARVSSRGANPVFTFDTVETPQPLRRALREGRAMLARHNEQRS
jgi:hypothetical protein